MKQFIKEYKKKITLRKINNLRPNKRQVDNNPLYWRGYVEALNDVITKIIDKK